MQVQLTQENFERLIFTFEQQCNERREQNERFDRIITQQNERFDKVIEINSELAISNKQLLALDMENKSAIHHLRRELTEVKKAYVNLRTAFDELKVENTGLQKSVDELQRSDLKHKEEIKRLQINSEVFRPGSPEGRRYDEFVRVTSSVGQRKHR